MAAGRARLAVDVVMNRLEKQMSTGTGNDLEGERLSALADGELDATQCAAVFEAWRGDGELRASWHAYHLIGDVLRSEDLASPVHRDVSLLRGVRSRLAGEPVVLAPAPLDRTAAIRRRGTTWRWSSAVAAGLLLVVGAFTLNRSAPDGTATETVIARSEPSPTAAVQPLPVALAAPDAAPEPVLANVEMIRDARLDRYLAAHKQFAGSSALGVPSTFLRSATVESGPR